MVKAIDDAYKLVEKLYLDILDLHRVLRGSLGKAGKEKLLTLVKAFKDTKCLDEMPAQDGILDTILEHAQEIVATPSKDSADAKEGYKKIEITLNKITFLIGVMMGMLLSMKQTCNPTLDVKSFVIKFEPEDDTVDAAADALNALTLNTTI